MAEGTYGSPYYQQMISPSEPSTPASKFATSVTRKKTRKWVEAKKINYDGSGWGDDDDEDEDDEDEAPAPAPPMPAASAHSAPRALPSQQSSLPSAALLSRTASPHPSLHLQTSSSPQSLPSQLPSQSLPSQSLPSQGLPSQGLPSQTLPSQTLPSQPWRQGSPAAPPSRESSPAVSSPRAGSLPTWRDGRSESPLGPRGQSPAGSSGPNGPRAFVRPSDIYKRAIGMDEPPLKKPTELPASTPASTPASPAPAPVELPAAAVKPTHDNVPPPVSKYADPSPQRKAISVASSAPAPSLAPAPALTPTPVVETVVETPATNAITDTAVDANGERRFSSSPKLPDLARFSMFSPDLLFGGAGLLASSDKHPVPSMPDSPATASFPAQQTAANVAAPVAAAPPAKLASVAEDLDRNSGAASPFSTSSVKSASAIRDSVGQNESLQDAVSTGAGSGKSTPAAEPDVSKAKALHNEKEPAPPAATASPDYSTTDQIAPLKPSRASQLFLPPAASLPLAPMGPRVMERAGTAGPVATAPASATNSPVKESDVLREEIIRTLSPVKSTHPDAISSSSSIAEQTKPATLHGGSSTVSLAKSDSLSATTAAEPTRTLTRDSSYLQDVYDDYWTPDDASGHEAYTPPPPVPPLSTGNTTATAAAAAAAAPASPSPEVAKAKPIDLLPSQTRQSTPSASSHSPAAASISSVPGTRSSSMAGTSNLRRRFSWEAEPESSPAPTVAAVAAAPAVPAAPSAQSAQSAMIATPPAVQDRSSPVLDPKASVSAVSVLSATQESIASPSPLSEGPTAASSASQAEPQAEQPAAQAPIRSMLDIGDEKPALRSMLDVDDVPAPAAAPAAPAAPAATETAAEEVTTPTAATAAAANRASASDSLHSAMTAQSTQSAQAAQAAAPSSAQSNQAGLGGANLASYGSGNEGTAQFLTLRQCMAFGTHGERMAKLAETRREYALADSGLSGWLANMTVIPEYSRASYAPLWDGPLTVPPPPSRPAAAVAAIAHVPHVNISSSQISNKSKEIFGVAAGKAGKGFLALRKKGFHKKSAN